MQDAMGLPACQMSLVIAIGWQQSLFIAHYPGGIAASRPTNAPGIEEPPHLKIKSGHFQSSWKCMLNSYYELILKYSFEMFGYTTR